MSNFFNLVFFEPLLNGLVLLVNNLPHHSVGLAIILLTVMVKFIIFPFTHKSILTQIKMKRVEPELREIKNNFKNDKQAQAKKTMELYKQHGVNPMTGILALFVQIPIIFALYRVFLGGVNFDSNHIYSFINAPEVANVMFLNLIDLTKSGNYFMAFLAAITQFIQMKLSIPPTNNQNKGANDGSFQDSLAKSMSFQMKYLMPAFVFFIGLKFSSGLALYWTTTNVFAIVHEYIVRRKAARLYGKSN